MTTISRISPHLFAMAMLLSTAAIGKAEVQSGTIEIHGRGEAMAAPQFAALSVTVVSICHETSRAAKDANAVLATKILEVMKRFQRSDKDRVTATGGPSERLTEYVDPGRQTILCERKWRSENTLTLETSALDALDEIQNQVLEEVDQGSTTGKPQTYAQVSRFSFHIYQETETKLRLEAQTKAWRDAKLQFDGFNQICNLKNARISKISQPQFHVRPEAKQHASPGAPASPLIPRNLQVEAEWKFVWTFDPDSTQCVQDALSDGR